MDKTSTVKIVRSVLHVTAGTGTSVRSTSDPKLMQTIGTNVRADRAVLHLYIYPNPTAGRRMLPVG